MSKSVFNIVATECRPEDEAKFNKWYNEVHIPLILKYKGIKRAGRYRQLGDNKEQPKYLAFYEFESKEALEAHQSSLELAAALDEMKETWKDRPFEIKWMAPYEPIQTWER
jgi:uncharacterized protein (TIGR02118 family)